MQEESNDMSLTVIRSGDAGSPVDPQALAACSSVGQWVLLAALARPDAGALRAAADTPVPTPAADFGPAWDIRLVDPRELPAPGEEEREEEAPEGDVIPIRMFEYLSTGRPIVSMLWPDQVEPFPDVVYGAHSSQEFLTLCEHALEELPSLFAGRRLAHGAAAAWTVRAERVSRILETAGLL